MTSEASERRAVQEPYEAELSKTRLEDENLQLKQAVLSHATVDQAIGVIVALGGLAPGRSWDVLREVSQRTNIKLRHVAELIIDWAQTGDLPRDIREELESRLRQAKCRVGGGNGAP
ncbi:ANTAR domain-containing protein [Streptomyces avermitilis]|uniref:ANTAR domain-containing protein n=1 Tax=Streptomyces avermitilis TaxID=33903 RepID=UPI0033A5AEB1